MTEKTREERIKEHVFAALRRSSYKWLPRSEVLRAARVERGKYRCAVCNKIYPKKEIYLDHVQAVIDPGDGFRDWETLIERMFPDHDGWQVLCKADHDTKSDIENTCRREVRRAINLMNKKLKEYYDKKGKIEVTEEDQ